MQRHGLASHLSVVKGSFTEDGGYRGAAGALDAADPPTALFVVNDLAAMGAMAAVTDRGLSVPEDVSVVGYDGTRLAGIRPLALTTVAQPLLELGTRAAALLCGQLDGEPSQASATRLAPALVVRRTTAAAPAPGETVDRPCTDAPPSQTHEGPGSPCR